jgi:histidinol-phosphatase (PHP family)
MHTPLCGHAQGDIDDYAAVAERRGLKGITVTCHNPLPDGQLLDSRMRPEQFPHYRWMIERAARTWAGRVDIRLGLECDYLPGLEKWLEEQIRSAPFDYVLGSVHPHTEEYRKAYWRGDSLEFQRLYFQHVAMAAETRLFDCLAHPDVVKHHSQSWELEAILPDILCALDRIAATGMAMELNTSAIENGFDELDPSPAMLREMCRRAIPVVVGSDAHRPGRVADRWPEAYDLLEEAGYRSVSFFLERRRIEVPIAEARKSIAGKMTKSE